MLTTIIWIIVIILFLAGVAGTFLPLIPGTPLVLLGIVIYAFYDDFEKIGTPFLITSIILTIATLAIDYIAQSMGSRRYGASKLATTLTLVGTIVGIFSGLWGVLIFPIIGAIIGELLSGKDFKQAAKSGTGAMIGFFAGTFFKLVIVFVMIGLFFVNVF